MSKSIGKLTGTGTVKYDTSPTKNLVKFLDEYNHEPVDTTLSNLSTWASDASGNLGNLMGDYTFNIDASDAARQQAQDATYQAYVDKLTPQFDRQTSDMQARLANQGISVGSEAYQRAMGDLQDNQNEALNQAGYQSVLAGQNAYSQDIQNQIAAGGFGNQAQQAYINQLLTALTGSSSGYDVAMDKYAAQSNLAAQQYAAKQQAMNNRLALVNGMTQAAGAVAGAAAGASDIRLKENIKPVGKLDNGLTVYCYNFKGENVPQIGLIAQEVQEVKPEAVVEREDGYLAVRYDIATEVEDVQ